MLSDVCFLFLNILTVLDFLKIFWEWEYFFHETNIDLFLFKFFSSIPPPDFCFVSLVFLHFVGRGSCRKFQVKIVSCFSSSFGLDCVLSSLYGDWRLWLCKWNKSHHMCFVYWITSSLRSFLHIVVVFQYAHYEMNSQSCIS